MHRSELHYDLPPERIAHSAVEPRDAARLLVLDRASGAIAHRTFRDVTDYLHPGDCLVINDTRVIPARFHCRRSSGGRIEALYLHDAADGWRVLLRGGARLREGERLSVEGADAALELLERGARGEWRVRPQPAVDALALLEQVGEPPLPPYIRRAAADPQDVQRYQTIYSQRAGAIAAPTAGLHFTAELLQRVRDRGVSIVPVTLHVGVGTFAPIEVEDLREHRMHSERFEVVAPALAALRAARAGGGAIVAVGTTSVRVLETIAERVEGSFKGDIRGETSIFIYPPREFRLVNRLITNFHLPESTLLALVMAFASPALIRAAYAEAIRAEYRFFSYGDAMLIL